MTAVDRFFAKVEFGERFQGTHCLLWTGGLTDRGYGTFRYNGKMCRAHRWLYKRWVAPIPEGLVLDHLCRVRHCVNPMHLEPVTQAENMARGLNATKTHCKHGHEFTDDNTYIFTHPDGRTMRQCRECHQRVTREHARRKRAHQPHGES